MNVKQLFQIKNPLQKRGLFDDISGHDSIKWVFNQALRADHPVHLLLVGKPGGGKTRFLKAIENRFPSQSYFALASGASGAGMVQKLFDKQPKYLLIDEIEHMKRSDIAVLQSLMQDGDLIETKKINTRSMTSLFCLCGM